MAPAAAKRRTDECHCRAEQAAREDMAARLYDVTTDDFAKRVTSMVRAVSEERESLKRTALKPAVAEEREKGNCRIRVDFQGDRRKRPGARHC